MRRLYRFITWALKPASETAPRYLATCVECEERSVDTPHAGEAQTWGLKHAGLTGHRDFVLSAFQRYRAEPVEPAAEQSG